MNIILNVKAYYDWEPLDGIQPTDEMVSALQVKPAADGSLLKRVRKETTTHTLVSLPESEIQSCMEHFDRVGSPKTRLKTVAWYLEEKVMPHHASLSDITSIEVESDPEFAKSLETLLLS